MRETVQLPDAVLRERERLLHACAAHLTSSGVRNLRVRGLAGYPDPDPLHIPVWNVPMVPDLMAESPEHTALVGVVVVSSELGEPSCGRRWQAFAQWAGRHAGNLAVYVHPEDEMRATRLAERWHLDPQCVDTVPRG